MKNLFKVLLVIQTMFVIAYSVDIVKAEEVGSVTMATIIVSPAPPRTITTGGSGATLTSQPGMPGTTIATPVQLNPALRSLKVTVTSPPNAAAIPTDIYLINQNTLQNVLTNTGVALVYNYADSNSGQQNSNMVSFNFSQGQLGTPCYGVYIRALADNVADPSGLSDTEPYFIQYVGRSWLGIPYVIDIDDNETRSDNDDSIGVVKFPSPINVDSNTQFGENINGDATVTYKLVNKFYFYPNFKA